MDHRELSAWLASMMGRAQAGGQREALAPFRERGPVRDLIRAVLRDDRWAEIVLRRSYRHPNGFDKVVLLSTDAYQLRLHVWRESEAAGHPATTGQAENIHNHRWDFSSVILLGGYRYQEFVPGTGGTEFHTYAYGSHRGTDSYSLEPLGLRPLVCCFDALLEAGSSYTLTSEVYHRVLSTPGRLTASLVLQGPHRPTPVMVFADRRLDTGTPLPLSRFSRSTLRHRLNDLATVL